MIELGAMNKTIEELEKELEELKASHRSAWDTYGSELCAGDMIHQEEKLEKEILKLKVVKRWKEMGLMEGVPLKPQVVEDPSQVVDD